MSFSLRRSVRLAIAALVFATAALPATGSAPLAAAKASQTAGKSTVHGRHASKHNTFRGHTLLAAGPVSLGAPTSISTACCLNGYATVTPHEFVVADVNRDGIPDLVSANIANTNSAPGVVVSLGYGPGTFHPAVVYSIRAGVQTVAVGDVNGDGFPDIVASESNQVDLLLGKGDGTFAAATVVISTTTGRDVRLADVNGDGKLDMIYTGSGNVAIFIGNGNGGFATQVNYTTDASGNNLAMATVADLNGDGHPDIVVATGASNVDVLLNSGSGTFAASVTYLHGSFWVEANNVVVADLNRDGVPDLVVAVGNGCCCCYYTAVMLGQGAGTFGPPTTLTNSDNSHDVAAADINGDGILDVISTNPGGSGVANHLEAYIGNGDGSFAAGTAYPTNATDLPVSLVVADLNRDGKPDLIASNHSPYSASFTEFSNTTAGVFAPLGGPLTGPELYGGSNFCFQCWVNHHTHTHVGDPVEAASGNFSQTSVDIAIPGRGIPLTFARTYNAQAAASNGMLGYGWTMDYGASLSQDGTTGRVTISQENGSQVLFAKVGAASPATYAPLYPRTIATLVSHLDGSWTLTRLANEKLTFNLGGQVTSMVDRNGYATTLSYTGTQLTKVTDSAARTLTLTYTGSLLTKVNDDQTGRNVVLGYNDGAGNLTDVTDIDGGNTHYTYEAGHLLDTVRDPRLNTVTTNHYDGSSPERVGSQQDGLSRTTSFSYGSGGSSTTVTDPKGNVTYDTYVAGLKTSVTRGYGTAQAATWTYVYDPATAAPTAITDPNANTSYLAYDANGDVLTASDPLGRTAVASYNAFDEPLTQTDALGVTTTLTYDVNGNLLTTSRPLTGTSQVQTVINAYGDSLHPGDVTAVTDPDGKTSSSGYDAYGDLTSSTDPLAHSTMRTYNADGWVLTEVSPKGNVSGCGCAAQYTTTYSYVIPGTTTTDQWGDVQTVTNPLGHVVTYGYDGDRNRTTVKDGSGNLTTSVYDLANQRTKVKRADAPQTTLTTDYNTDGTVLDQKDGKGNAIQTYGYNSLAQVTSVKDALNNETDYTYDGVGNQLTKQDPGGNCATASKCTTRAYDVANQLSSVTYSDGVTPTVSAISYDADGQKQSWTDGSGSWIQAFDSLHRLTSVTEGANGIVAYTYNLRNLPLTITYPGGSHAVAETYDDAGRWTKVQDWNGNITTIGYDVNSNLTTYTLPSATTVVDTLGYNKADQHTSIADNKGATSFFAANYTYNPAAQLITDSSAPTSQTKFKYSNLNQVCYAGATNTTSCSNPPTGSAPFAYDAADNLVKLNTTTQQFNAADQLCWTLGAASSNACTSPPSGATSFAYDGRGNRSSQVPSAGAATCDVYDQANRLVKVSTGTGSTCTSPATLGTYSYNGAGLRMAKTVAGVTATQAWDLAAGLPVLLEDKSSSTLDYVYGPGGLPLEQVNGTTTLWYHHDQLGSTRAITTAIGGTQATYQYDPYGNTLATTGSATNPFLYAGQYKDTESGLYYLRARYYDPATAQFLTVDPMVATTRSPYGYVGGNPLNGSDPTGLDNCGAFAFFCDAVASGWSATGGQVVNNIQNFASSSHTLGVCADVGAGGFGFGGNAQFCPVVRFNGFTPAGFGTTETVGGGAGIGIGLTGTIDLQISNAQRISSLGGPFASVSAGGGADFGGQGGISAGFDTCHQFVAVANAGAGVGEGVWGEVGPSNTWTQTWFGN